MRGHNFLSLGANPVLNYFPFFLSQYCTKLSALVLFCSKHIWLLNAWMLNWYHSISIWNNTHARWWLHRHLSSFRIAFDLKHLPQFWPFHNNKRLSCLKSAYLKIEKDTPLAIEGYKFTNEWSAGVMVSVSRGEWQCCWKFCVFNSANILTVVIWLVEEHKVAMALAFRPVCLLNFRLFLFRVKEQTVPYFQGSNERIVWLQWPLLS